jgi:hypothetical protein
MWADCGVFASLSNPLFELKKTASPSHGTPDVFSKRVFVVVLRLV